jgi:hypothetical protein
MAIKLPAADNLATSKVPKEPALKKLVEKWINEKLVPKVMDHNSQIDLKKRTVEGMVYLEAPHDYYGKTQKEWKEHFEIFIVPLGYTPIYTHDGGGMYDVVGVKWKVAL